MFNNAITVNASCFSRVSLRASILCMKKLIAAIIVIIVAAAGIIYYQQMALMPSQDSVSQQDSIMMDNGQMEQDAMMQEDFPPNPPPQPGETMEGGAMMEKIDGPFYDRAGNEVVDSWTGIDIRSSGDAVVNIHARLPDAPPNMYYRAWLVQEQNGELQALDFGPLEWNNDGIYRTTISTNISVLNGFTQSRITLEIEQNPVGPGIPVATGTARISS